MRRNLFLLISGVFFLIRPLGAEPAISGDAQRELSSQTNSLAKQEKNIRQKLTEKPVIEIKKDDEKTDDEQGPVFFVKKIIVEGNTAVPSKDFNSFTSAFENRKVSFRHLRSFSDIITGVYRGAGYVTSRAYLPPQTVDDETVTIKIVEGKVGKVFVEGNRYFSTKSYQRRMKFPADRIFRYQDLESKLYFLNQLPDRQAKAFLIPGEELASSDIILKVKDKNPFHVYYNVNNRGTKLTHRVRHGLHVDHNNFLGYDDSLNTAFTTTEEGAFNGGSFSYEFPLEQWPLTLSLSASYVKTRLIGYLKSSQIEGESLSVSPGLTYHLLQSPQKNIDFQIRLEYINSISTLAGNRTSVDRIRAIQAGPQFTFQDAGGRTIINPQIHVGLPDFLGGLKDIDSNASVQNSGGEFTFYTLNGVRLQRLPKSRLLILRAGGQWTADTLTSVEQYRAGGAYSVRGYPESDSAGDYGWNSSAEFSSPLPLLPAEWKVPYTQKTWKSSLRLVGFLDSAKTYLRQRALPATVKDKFLLGTGFGMRLNIDDYISAQIDLGFPLGDDSSDKNNPQVHLGAMVGF